MTQNVAPTQHLNDAQSNNQVVRATYNYPAAGDPFPVGGEEVLLLTVGGICVRGTWNATGGFIGWCKMPQRDRVKEQSLSNLRVHAPMASGSLTTEKENQPLAFKPIGS